jgi:hypothetical protein
MRIHAKDFLQDDKTGFGLATWLGDVGVKLVAVDGL